MRRPVTVLLALTLAGCSAAPAPVPAPAPAPAPTTSATAAPAPLPPPEALSEVIMRMADPEVPGTDKITLLQNGAAPDARALDSFATALRDVGYLPLTVTVRDLRWSDTAPGDVLATLTLTGPTPAGDRPPEFSIPMEFTPGAQGWQLSRDTAQSLLAFGTPG